MRDTRPSTNSIKKSKKSKVSIGVAATVLAAATAVIATPGAAWAAYDSVYCDVSFPSKTTCVTTPDIYPHSSQYWLRYRLPSLTAVKLVDRTTGTVVAQTGSGLTANDAWHTYYGLNASHKYRLEVAVGFSAGGRSRLANCTTRPDGSSC
ncbi:hypothetical protein Daura_40060 [Dactylosporangium aurantiacum]|uniref:Secreted protein n=1 Tax=Dactylosporangium aurantiacum TaxID=35754 RepID=A0A9Q9MFM4_9ACTN|nr:hypothetical protein [Dactylosporangium aurantiacum]MDG6101378.1 hypothetical protein [Dactylosporangium aurantiacum]UWZ52765.1 hypothetical protein Daura_40060 [Dactylosporangium aurantiacum]